MNKFLKLLLKTVCVLVIISILLIPVTHVFGAINPVNEHNAAADSIKTVIGALISLSTGPLTAALAGLVNAVILVIFLLLYFIFSPLSAGFAFPFPDQIIFNKIGFFDPNFIVLPSKTLGGTDYITNAPVYILKDVISNIYYTGFTIAGTIFIIVAMIAGIRMAVSTIASEKAHYKQALISWITGVALLFTTHFIILGIFTINETFVNAISKAADNIEFKIDILQIIPGFGSTVGKALSSIVGQVSSWFGGSSQPTAVSVYGYGGMILMFAGYGIGGDLVSSIVCGILLGQTCALIIMYLKRLFYCIILGMIAPLIIAVDALKKV
jgi:hypothetical protein